MIIKHVEPDNETYLNDICTGIEDVQAHIADDIDHQVNKFGYQRIDGMNWIGVLVEEFGETAQAYLKKQYDEAEAEAMQTIACLTRFIIEVRREKAGIAETERAFYTRAQ